MLDRLRREPIKEVVIDIANGLDVDPATQGESVSDPVKRFDTYDFRYQEVVERFAERARNFVSIDEELRRIPLLRKESVKAVRDLMADVRVGLQVDIQRVEPVIEKMMMSVMRHSDALIPLLRLKDHSQYSFEHSVSVAALSLAFGKTLGFDRDTLHQMALGALLHDIGKARIPESILEKPGGLNEYETAQMQLHVAEGRDVLASLPGISQVALECAAFHHERFDGSGYPYGLKGEQIPIHAQVVAIVDCYDAMTSVRCYKNPLEPTEALRSLFGLANRHFREDMLMLFIRTVGIYPVGSLVRLDNGYLAIVLEVDRNNLLNPRLQVIFDSRSKAYILPFELNLARRKGGISIVDFEPFAHWGIDPYRAARC